MYIYFYKVLFGLVWAKVVKAGWLVGWWLCKLSNLLMQWAVGGGVGLF